LSCFFRLEGSSDSNDDKDDDAVPDFSFATSRNSKEDEPGVMGPETERFTATLLRERRDDQKALLFACGGVVLGESDGRAGSVV